MLASEAVVHWVVYEATGTLVLKNTGYRRPVSRGKAAWVKAQNWVTARADGAIALGLPLASVEAVPADRVPAGVLLHLRELERKAQRRTATAAPKRGKRRVRKR